MDKYYEYLAVHVLNQNEIVTYRWLSRELKVHVNLAKQMLWEFHHKQNAKKPGSVHATYLISGPVKDARSDISDASQGEEDAMMTSSPPLPSSSIPADNESHLYHVPKRSVTLVREQHLEQARKQFEEVTSIHIYSLQSDSLGDFQALTECTRRITAMLRTEDNMQTWKQYGTIHNADARRRTRKTPLPPARPTQAVTQATAKSEMKVVGNTNVTESKKPSMPGPPKRQGSGIAASFAKSASKAKPSSKPPSVPVAQPEDENMAGFSDEDLEDDKANTAADIDVGAATGTSKKDRKAELEAMMDVDDEEMEDVKEPEAGEQIEEKAVAPTVEESVAMTDVRIENGRRRGRRRVMKQKTVRDEEGYLVTREEPGWESFSEDEPVPKKVKTSAPMPALSKKSAKPGQGNIMNFFSKK